MSSSNSKSTVSTENLGEQIAALRDELRKLVSSLPDDVTEGLEKAGERISRTSREARATATETVTGHPLTAVGVAVGVGLLVGMMARRG